MNEKERMDRIEEDLKAALRSVPDQAAVELGSYFLTAALIFFGTIGFWHFASTRPYVLALLVAAYVLFLISLVRSDRGIRPGVLGRAAKAFVYGLMVTVAEVPRLVWRNYRIWKARRRKLLNDISVGVRNNGTLDLDMAGLDGGEWTLHNIDLEDAEFLLEEMQASVERARKIKARLDAAKAGPPPSAPGGEHEEL